MTDCVFCGLIEEKANKLFENEDVFAMLSPEPALPGHVIVLPKKHAPILEAVPDFVVESMFKVANKIGVAVFEGLGAQGTNVMVENGTAAGQRHNHTMVHVVPRFEKDNLALGWEPKQASEGDLAKMEGTLKGETKNVGVFEEAETKPVEVDAPEEVQEDYRTKHLRRVP